MINNAAPITAHPAALAPNARMTAPLRTAMIGHIAAAWPEFAEIRRAAEARGHKRLASAVSAATNEARVAIAAAVLAAIPDARAPGPHLAADLAADQDTYARAQILAGHARAIACDGAQQLAEAWKLSAGQCAFVVDAFRQTAGPPEAPTCAARVPVPTSGPRPERSPYAQAVPTMLACIGGGVSLERALRLAATLGDGAYSHDDRSFYPDDLRLGPLAARIDLLAGAERLAVRVGEGEQPLALFVVDGLVAAISGQARLRTSWLADARAAAGGLESLPDFIALPRDEAGRPIIPTSRVTALVEAQAAWAVELGQIDGVTAAITRGKLVMPKHSAPSQQTALRNHPSWEHDEEAKRALGPVIAKWLATGVLEYVGWNDRLPVLLQPCGAVPKGTAPFYRLITDARFANSMYSDWGVAYTTAAQLSSTLNRCDFTFSIDISDAYHLSLWAGCGGELRPTRRPVIAAAGGPGPRVTWLDALVNGCTPSSCLGGCDKDLSGIVIDGHVFRFASCQFGQKTAGSPLGSIVRSVARYFARLPDPVHVAAWVDDLIFIMATPEHEECDGLAGGCPTCAEAYQRALRVQEQWHDKARRLNIPLSGKGHTAAQQGVFTGVTIDTVRGAFGMLPDKLESLRSARAALALSAMSTPRLIARVRGKFLHYGCAIPFLAMVAPTLSQDMHEHTTGTGPVAVPSVREEAAGDIDWDRPVPVTDRARRALALAEEIIAVYGETGQPIWPTVPSSFFGRFLAGELGDIRPLVITYDASVHGWGAILRTSPGEAGREIVGGYTEARELLGAAFLDPAQLGDDPAAQVYREALAGLLATRAASKLFALERYTVLIRGDCVGALTALRKGSFRSPALQDIAIRFAELCVGLRLPPPMLLHAPGSVMKAERVDDLSRAVAQQLRSHESSPALRRLVVLEAHRLGGPISVDLFATASNALVPRFFSRTAEPDSEAIDALAQPDWAASRCPGCHLLHRETCYVFPPRAMLARAIAKARSDGLRGVWVVPFAITDPMWPTLMAASLTRVPGQRERCVIVPADARYVRVCQGEPAYAERLAIFAADFSNARARSLAELSPACSAFSAHRPRPALQLALDGADRRRIAGALLRLGLEGRRTSADEEARKRARR